MNTNPQPDEPLAQVDSNAIEGRRHFIKGVVGISAGVALLVTGAFDKFFRFFFGPRLTRDQEMDLMQQRIGRLKQTASVRQLELEREQSDYILVAPLADLTSTAGKYFIDYQMCPALAFVGKDGLPNLLSAKCTHLGCTVGKEVDDKGKILCPCHTSYFDVTTGQPDANSPAKTPLPHIGWVLMDKSGKVIASRQSSGVTNGDTTAKALSGTSVFIAKKET
jgi:nitrite reductase/ring-hydroxylating ferredoxin subunit